MRTKLSLVDVARSSEPRDLPLLTWYLRADYIGDVGLKSPMGRMLDEAQLCHGTKAPAEIVRHLSYDPSDEILEAASKLIRVERRWHQLTRRNRDALRIAYGDVPNPLPTWGRVGSIAPHLRSAWASWQASGTTKSLTAWLAGLNKTKAPPESIRLAAKFKREAQGILDTAISAWDATGRGR